MGWAEAAWIGPTLVAVVASFVQYRTHRNSLSAERERSAADRRAAVADRRLDTVRSGYLSVMAAAAGLAAAMDDAQAAFTASRTYVIEWHTNLKTSLKESGGVVDAFGSSDSRRALERTRRLVAGAALAEARLADAKRLASGRVAAGNRERAEELLNEAATALTMESLLWRDALEALLAAMRADLQRFESE